MNKYLGILIIAGLVGMGIGALVIWFNKGSLPRFWLIVKITANGYDPSHLTISKGETVTFVNAGENDYWPASNIHPTHEIYPEFDPRKPIPSGKSWSFVFDKEGIWRFHDHLYPQLTGTIIVQ